MGIGNDRSAAPLRELDNREDTADEQPTQLFNADAFNEALERAILEAEFAVDPSEEPEALSEITESDLALIEANPALERSEATLHGDSTGARGQTLAWTGPVGWYVGGFATCIALQLLWAALT